MSQKNLFENLDLIFSFVGVAGGLVITSLYLVSPTIQLFSMGVSLIFACIIYLLIRNKQTNVKLTTNFATEKLIFEILFFIFFTFMVYILHVSDSRPPLYFISLSVCAGLLAISISLIDTNIEKIMQILKIYMVSFAAKYSIYDIAGSIPGIDSRTHARMNVFLSQTGNIDSLFDKETHFPIMHIQTAVTQILADTSIKDASNFAVIVPFVFLSVCVYLFARSLFGEKIGLLAMLIVNTTDFHIYWGASPQTTTFGVILYYLIFYALFKKYLSPHGTRWTSISLMLIFIFIYTHAVSSFIFLMTLMGLLAGLILYERMIKREGSIFLGGITLITSISLLMHWFNAPYSKGGSSFFDKIASMLIIHLTENVGILNRPERISAYSTTFSPFIERYADTLGLSILLIFAIIGCLFWLSPKYICKLNFSFITCITILLGVTLVFPFFGLRNILPSRWFVFEYFLLSIMAAFSIIKILELFKRDCFKKAFLGFTFFILVFFMSSCTLGNSDSPLWLKESTISTTYTLSEVKGAETLSLFSDALICDGRYGTSELWFNSDPNDTYFDFSDNALDGNGTVVIWRNYMLSRPIKYRSPSKHVAPIKVLGPEFLVKLNKYDKIYHSEGICGYYII